MLSLRNLSTLNIVLLSSDLINPGSGIVLTLIFR